MGKVTDARERVTDIWERVNDAWEKVYWYLSSRTSPLHKVLSKAIIPPRHNINIISLNVISDSLYD